MLSIIIYTHSSFFDIFKIQLDYVTKLFKDIPCNVYVFSDIIYNVGGRRISKKNNRLISRRTKKNKNKKNGGGNQQLKYKNILYDDNKPYFSRLNDCINQVDSEYIIIMHDNDVLISFNKDIINPLIDAMKNNNIDSVELRNWKVMPEIHIYETLSISVKKKEDDPIGVYMYSVKPRLWKKQSALNLFSKFPNYTYKDSENTTIQNYVINNQKTYTLCDTNYLRSTWDNFYSPFFCCIHLTGHSKLLPFKEKSNLDIFVQNEFKNIHDKYLKDTKREFIR